MINKKKKTRKQKQNCIMQIPLLTCHNLLTACFQDFYVTAVFCDSIFYKQWPKNWRVWIQLKARTANDICFLCKQIFVL